MSTDAPTRLPPAINSEGSTGKRKRGDDDPANGDGTPTRGVRKVSNKHLKHYCVN
jgi:hypothetical protein